jgi:acyl carrier protein
MNANDFLRNLEEALEVPKNSINANDALNNLESWDSMAALTFMSLADQKFQVMVSGAQLQNCRSVRDLLGLLGDKILFDP